MSNFYFHKTLPNLLIEVDAEGTTWATNMVASKQYQRRRKIVVFQSQLVLMSKATQNVMKNTYA